MNAHEDRPPAEALADEMLERPAFEVDPRARPELKPRALRRGGEVRCPRRHLLGASVRRPPYGLWLVWHGGLWGDGWRFGWADEVPDRAELLVWCAPCNMNHTIDMSAPTHPRLLR